MADTTIADLPAAGAITGDELVPIVKGGVTSKTTASALGGAAYKVYRALLSQSGTDAPVATILENTLGDTPVITRDDLGNYVITLAGAFPQNKTACIFSVDGVYANAFTVTGGRHTDDTVNFYALDDAWNSVELGGQATFVQITVDP